MSDDSDVIIIEDAKKDKRFSKNPFVQNAPGICFYAGVFLTTPKGHHLGALCVLDLIPRKLTKEHIAALKTLAHQVSQLFELRKSKKTEASKSEALKNKGKPLENIVKATRIGIWEWCINKNKITFNDQGVKLIGHSLHTFKNVKREVWESFIHPEDVPAAVHMQKNISTINQIPIMFSIECSMKMDMWYWFMKRAKYLIGLLKIMF